MGGNALSVNTVRLNKYDYEAVSAELLSKLQIILPKSRLDVVKAYASKPDFGDIDILVESTPDYDPVKISEALGATELVRNGTVSSLGINTAQGIFQLDLIKTKPTCYEFSKRYFAMNDLGNLLGRCAHKAGFKFGHEGLMCVVRDKTNSSNVLAELTVTTDWDSALSFLGYDPKDYDRGFNGGFVSLEDIFKFVVTSPYINKDIFLLDNRNAVSRIRDAKRKTYMSFLKWLDKTPLLNNFDWTLKEALREDFLSQALYTFSDFKEAYNKAVSDSDTRKHLAGVFNGVIVSNLTGLTGKGLGEFMRAFKASYGATENFNAWLLASTESDIASKILKYEDSYVTAN